MVQGNATLVVDLGNSSTKAKVLFGKDEKSGKFRERRFDVSNVFAPIDSGYEVSSDYSDETSTIIRVDTELNGHKIIGDFCNGELQAKEKPLSVIKPSATDKKYNLDSTVLSLHLALLYGYKAVMSIQRCTDYSQMDITWTIVALLPPGDVDNGKEAMTALIKSINHLECVFPKVNLDIVIKNVAILPEGYCAYAGCIYDVGRVFRPDYKFLKDEFVLVIDIGAGTTDICAIRDNKLVQNSKYTVQQGGNNVYQLVRRQLMMRGLMLDDASIKEGVVAGSVRDGAKKVSIVEEVNSAKNDVAQKLVAEIQNFFEVSDLKARSVGYVLICGGGSIDDGESTHIRPISEIVMEYFKQLAPNSEMVDIPTHVVQKELEDGDVKKVEEKISPRDLNLIGASILAEVL